MARFRKEVCSRTEGQAMLRELRIIWPYWHVRQKIVIKGTLFDLFKRFNKSPDKARLAGEIAVYRKQLGIVVITYLIDPILHRAVRGVIRGT